MYYVYVFRNKKSQQLKALVSQDEGYTNKNLGEMILFETHQTKAGSEKRKDYLNTAAGKIWLKQSLPNIFLK